MTSTCASAAIVGPGSIGTDLPAKLVDNPLPMTPGDVFRAECDRLGPVTVRIT